MYIVRCTNAVYTYTVYISEDIGGGFNLAFWDFQEICQIL